MEAQLNFYVEVRQPYINTSQQVTSGRSCKRHRSSQLGLFTSYKAPKLISLIFSVSVSI